MAAVYGTSSAGASYKIVPVLIVQQLYREILAVADENDGRLKNRVMMYLDEFGTIPKIDGAEMMFSASRSRRVSIVAIIQSPRPAPEELR